MRTGNAHVNASEQLHDNVYGSTFALYDKKALLEFIEPFRVRIKSNGLVPADIFGGRRCLDAGCGNGRGSLFMLESGAAQVTAIDISERNVETTRRNVANFGYSNFTCHRTSLETLPFDTESFEFIWCNGVIMHTANPDRCIAELARVARLGGRMWLYVYGAGGIYWNFVRRFRAMLTHVSVDRLIAALKLLNYPVRFIAEYVDDWKTPFLRAYRAKTVEKKLGELGFVDIQRLLKGMPYDTCARMTDFAADRPLLGEGDLRYLAVRGATTREGCETLNEDYVDDPAEVDSTVAKLFGMALDDLATLVHGKDLATIAVCARIQRYLRESVLSKDAEIDVHSISQYLKESGELVADLYRIPRN